MVSPVKEPSRPVLTIGADPEFFLFKDGKPISAHDLVPGDKLNPHPMKRGACVQADGTAVEFNISPASTKEEFATNIQDALDQIRRLVPKDMEFKFHPTVKYPSKYFKSLPEKAVELGCTPDFCSKRGGARNPKPKNIGTMRTGSFHIHLGWGKKLDVKDLGHLFDCCFIVNSLDNYFNSYRHLWDSDRKRFKMYGRPGAFRPKPYGVEYRSLSNAILNFPQLWPWVFESAHTIFYNGLETGIVLPTGYAPPSATKCVEDKSRYGYSYQTVEYTVPERIEKLNAHYRRYVPDMPCFPTDFPVVKGGKTVHEIMSAIDEEEYEDYEDF